VDNSQPIIVKKIKKGGHGHHGGAWKVAYADFVTAMMAFFLLMWLLGNTTEGERRAISDYFLNPSAIQGKGGSSTSPIDMGGGLDSRKQLPAENPSDQDFSSEQPQVDRQQFTQEARKKEKKRLESLMEDLNKAIQASQALKPFKDQLLLDITEQGLRIQIVDKENRPMFDLGGSSLKSYTKEILHELDRFLVEVPNKISISGHTDARPFAGGASFTNWELSTDRANACRRELISGGLPQTKVAQVVGLASMVLFDKKNPYNPINRRISIVVLTKDAEAAILNKEGSREINFSDLITKESATTAPQPASSREVVAEAQASAGVVRPATRKPKRKNEMDHSEPQNKPDRIALPSLPGVPGLGSAD
jgi:chemotaxis protein MotB